MRGKKIIRGKCARVLHHPQGAFSPSGDSVAWPHTSCQPFSSLPLACGLEISESDHFTALQRHSKFSGESERMCLPLHTVPLPSSTSKSPPPREPRQCLAKKPSPLHQGQTVDHQAFALIPKGAKISLLGHENRPLIPSHRTWIRKPLPVAVTEGTLLVCHPSLGLKGRQHSSRKKHIIIAEDPCKVIKTLFNQGNMSKVESRVTAPKNNSPFDPQKKRCLIKVYDHGQCEDNCLIR